MMRDCLLTDCGRLLSGRAIGFVASCLMFSCTFDQEGLATGLVTKTGTVGTVTDNGGLCGTGVTHDADTYFNRNSLYFDIQLSQTNRNLLAQTIGANKAFLGADCGPQNEPKACAYAVTSLIVIQRPYVPFYDFNSAADHNQPLGSTEVGFFLAFAPSPAEAESVPMRSCRAKQVSGGFPAYIERRTTKIRRDILGTDGSSTLPDLDTRCDRAGDIDMALYGLQEAVEFAGVSLGAEQLLLQCCLFTPILEGFYY